MATRGPHSSKIGKETTTGEPSTKRARYTASRKHRQKIKFPGPYLGFENEKLRPELRRSLHVDRRFFQYGIQPGSIWEIKGQDGSGKTFLLTYFIARVLSLYPEKKVVLVDTRRKFSAKNFISILYHVDEDLKKCHQRNLNEYKSSLGYRNPKIESYLDRVLIFNCHSPEQLMLTLGPTGESSLEKLLLQDSRVGLIAIDAIDDYSNSEFMSSVWADQWPNIMHALTQAVCSTKCPVLCVTLVPAGGYMYRTKWGQSKQPYFVNNAAKSSLPQSTQASGVSPQGDATDNDKLVLKTNRNFTIDYTAFTHILEIIPASVAAKEKLQLSKKTKITHYVTAYLRSRQSANTAGSGGNHRVKFSIFSDMLWVEQEASSSQM